MGDRMIILQGTGRIANLHEYVRRDAAGVRKLSGQSPRSQLLHVIKDLPHARRTRRYSIIASNKLIVTPSTPLIVLSIIPPVTLQPLPDPSNIHHVVARSV